MRTGLFLLILLSTWTLTQEIALGAVRALKIVKKNTNGCHTPNPAIVQTYWNLGSTPFVLDRKPTEQQKRSTPSELAVHYRQTLKSLRESQYLKKLLTQNLRYEKTRKDIAADVLDEFNEEFPNINQETDFHPEGDPNNICNYIYFMLTKMSTNQLKTSISLDELMEFCVSPTMITMMAAHHLVEAEDLQQAFLTL